MNKIAQGRVDPPITLLIYVTVMSQTSYTQTAAQKTTSRFHVEKTKDF